MAKIVIDARESGTSTGRYIDKLLEHMGALNPKHDITVLVKPHRLDFMMKTTPNFTVQTTPYKEFTFGEQLGFWRQVRSFKADMVHFGKDHQPVLYKGRVVTTMHDLTTARFRNPDKHPLVFGIKQVVYLWVVRRVAKKSNAILTPTEFVKNDVVKFTHINPNKVTVTYEATEPIAEEAEPLNSLLGKLFIMYVGRPTPHKNLARLIDAFKILQKQNPELRLVLAGKKDANYQAHADRVKREGIKNVIFTDFITDGQLRWLLENCTAYIFPSLSEGFGLPGLEAMLQGAPVVSSNATCLPEVYGDAAYYFDPTDVMDMAEKINEVINNAKLRQELSAKGKKQAAKYSWRRMAEQTLAVYEATLRQKL